VKKGEKEWKKIFLMLKWREKFFVEFVFNKSKEN
jgi:hypothetical protein